MAPRKKSVRDSENVEQAPEQEAFSQSKRPEEGRFLLQVDGQTKRSYETNEAAQAAGLVIKNSHPNVRVAIYDRVDSVNTLVNAS